MDAFLWDLICIFLFTVGFALLYYSSDGLLKCLQWISCRFQVHPVIIGILILGMNPQITILSTTAAFHHLPYLSMGSIIGNAIISLTLSLALPLLLFREDPYLKLMTENLQKNDTLNVPSFYFNILSVSTFVIALGATPFVASFSYNILLMAIINLHFFGAFIVKNFLKYQQAQCLDIHIESAINMNMDKMDEISGFTKSKEEHNQLKDDAFYDDDTDE